MKYKPRKPLSHRTPDRCVMCGTDNVWALETPEGGMVCEDCYLDRHDLHGVFHAGCGLCWQQYREDKAVLEGRIR